MNRQFTLPTAARITHIDEENYRTKTFALDVSMDAYPGQFVMVWLPRFDEKPFSLVSADPVTLMISDVGPFSSLIHDKRPGDNLWLRGPFGHGFRVPPSQRRIALVGGGYGVAPLYWLAKSQQGRTAAITTVIGARAADDILYAARFRALQSPQEGPDYASSSHASTHRLLVTTEDGSEGARGLVTDVLKPLLEAKEVDGIYACGPHGMLSALRVLAGQHGLPSQLSWEAYMRCGIGICGSCEHEGQVLCLDGPVIATAD